MRLLRVPDGSGTNLEEAVDDGGGLERRGGLLDTGDHFYIARVYSCVDMVTKAAVRRRGTWEDGEDPGRRSERVPRAGRARASVHTAIEQGELQSGAYRECDGAVARWERKKS